MLNLSELGLMHLYFHQIETGDARPIKQATYRVCPQKKYAIDRHIEELLQNDITKPSISPWQSSVVLVKQKDSNYILTVDYRKLIVSVYPCSIHHPILKIQLMLLEGLKFNFTSLSASHLASSSPVTPRHCTSLSVHILEFTNSPPAFSMAMSEVLREMTFKNAAVYAHYILLYSKHYGEHLSHLQQVFNCL